MSSQFVRMMSSLKFFVVTLFLLSCLVPGPSFIFNVITGSRVMTVFLYKGSTRNLEIENTPSESCPVSEDVTE